MEKIMGVDFVRGMAERSARALRVENRDRIIRLARERAKIEEELELLGYQDEPKEHWS